MPHVKQFPLGRNCVLEVGGVVLWSVTDAYRRVVTDEIRATKRHGIASRRLPIRKTREIDFTVTDAVEIEYVTALAVRRTSALTGATIRPDSWHGRAAVDVLQPRPELSSVRVLLLPQGFSVGDERTVPGACLTNWEFPCVVIGPDIDEPLAAAAVSRFVLSEWD